MEKSKLWVAFFIVEKDLAIEKLRKTLTKPQRMFFKTQAELRLNRRFFSDTCFLLYVLHALFCQITIVRAQLKRAAHI
jgi:hypothetical protein